MDFEVFRNSIELFYNGNDDQRIEAENALNSIPEKDFLTFLQYLDFIISDDTQIFKLRAATIMYSFVKHNRLFFQEEIFSNHCKLFFQILPKVYSDKENTEVLKNIVSNIVSEILIYSINKFNLANELNAILAIFDQNDTTIPYISKIIADTLYGIDNFSFFEINYLINLMQFDSNPINRFNLLLSIAIHVPDCQFLQENFLYFLKSIPILLLPNSYQLLSDFCERIPLFFEQNFTELAEFLIQSIEDSPNECKIQALLFSCDLAKFCTDICKSNPEFVKNLILNLINTMGDIGDDIEWFEDINDRNPSAVSCDIFNEITAKLSSTELLETIINYFMQQINEPTDWKVIYACLTAISCTSSCTLSYLIEDEDTDSSRESLIQFMAPIIDILNTDDVHPRIRYASFQVINNFCSVMPSFFPLALFDQLFPHLISYVTEEQNVLVRRASIDALSSFIKNTSRETLSPLYPSIIETLLSLITDCDDNQCCEKLLFCLGLFIMGIGDTFDRLEDVTGVLQQIYEIAEDQHLKFTAITTFAMCLNKRSTSQEINQISLDFLQILVEIRESLYENEDLERCHIAIILLIQALSNDISVVADYLFQNFLQTAKTEISIVVLHHCDNDIDVSCMKRIPSPIIGDKLFINESQVTDVVRSLKILTVLVKLIDVNQSNYLNECANISADILNRDIFIETMADHALSLLIQCFRSSENSDFKCQILTTVVEVFNCLPSSIIITPSFVNAIVITVSELISHAKEIEWGNEQEIEKLLISITKITERLFDALQKIVMKKKADNIDEIQIDLPISLFQICLSNIPSLYSEIIEFNFSKAIEFFETSLEAKLMTMFNDKLVSKTALEIWFTFVIKLFDINRISSIYDIIMQWIEEDNDYELKQSIFVCLHNAFKIIKVDPEIFEKYYGLFIKLFEGESLMANVTVNDSALGAFCALVSSNLNYSNHEVDAEVLMNNLPIESIEDISETVYNLFLFFVANYPQWFLNEDNFSATISHMVQTYECSCISEKSRNNVKLVFKKIMKSEKSLWLRDLYSEMTPLQQKCIKTILAAIAKLQK